MAASWMASLSLRRRLCSRLPGSVSQYVYVDVYRTCGPCNSIPGGQAIAYLYDSTTDAAGYVATVNGQVLVVFRGTSDLDVRVDRVSACLSSRPHSLMSPLPPAPHLMVAMRW